MIRLSTVPTPPPSLLYKCLNTAVATRRFLLSQTVIRHSGLSPRVSTDVFDSSDVISNPKPLSLILRYSAMHSAVQSFNSSPVVRHRCRLTRQHRLPKLLPMTWSPSPPPIVIAPDHADEFHLDIHISRCVHHYKLTLAVVKCFRLIGFGFS